jgi:hypothetical protein
MFFGSTFHLHADLPELGREEESSSFDASSPYALLRLCDKYGATGALEEELGRRSGVALIAAVGRLWLVDMHEGPSMLAFVAGRILRQLR